MASSPTKTVRPIISEGITTHYSWTVRFSTNDTPDRKQGKISVARLAKELKLNEKKALKEAESQTHQAASEFIDSLKDGVMSVPNTPESVGAITTSQINSQTNPMRDTPLHLITSLSSTSIQP